MKTGVLTPVQQSQYGTPIFIIPYKERTVRFITDYHRLNPKLIIKAHSLPIIGETMQKLEGYQYAATLDINREYYTIRLSPDSQDMTTIVTEFGKFRYNRLAMGMFTSGYISQTRVDELLGDIEGIKTYIDGLVLRNYCFTNHIEKLRIIFVRFRAAVLKDIAPRFSFGLKEITYLGYVITREGIKHDPKKLKGIMDLVRPTTITEERALICMLHYCRDMWPKK